MFWYPSKRTRLKHFLYLKGLFPFSIYLSRKLRNLSQPRHKSMPRRIPPFIGPYIAHIFHPTGWRAVFCVAQKCLIKMKLLSLMPSSWGISFGSLPKSHASSNCIWCDFLWFTLFWLLTVMLLPPVYVPSPFSQHVCHVRLNMFGVYPEISIFHADYGLTFLIRTQHRLVVQLTLAILFRCPMCA